MIVDAGTTTYTNVESTQSTTTSSYGNTWYSDDYITITTQRDSFYLEDLEDLYEKLLRRLIQKQCKSGWVQHIDTYKEPKTYKTNLKGVRLDGRGWGNKNK